MADVDPSSTGVVGHLQTLLLTTADVAGFLQQLALLSTQVITDPLSCGVTVRYDGSVMTVASSDDRAVSLDETQYRTRTGPCLQALNTGHLVLSQDCRIEARWPAYTAFAVGRGLRCSLSLPLTTGGDTFGAINVYGFDEPNLFGRAEQRQLQLFAAQAAGALRLATRRHHDAVLLAQLEDALKSRSVVDQAMGILMERHQLTSTQAFDLLRRQSQHRKVKLRDVAATLVTRAADQRESRDDTSGKLS